MSVHLSATRLYCVKTAKRVIKLFSSSGSHIILVFFDTKPYGNILTATPPHQQEAELSQRGRVMLRVIEYFIQPLSVTQGHSK